MSAPFSPVLKLLPHQRIGPRPLPAFPVALFGATRDCGGKNVKIGRRGTTKEDGGLDAQTWCPLTPRAARDSLVEVRKRAPQVGSATSPPISERPRKASTHERFGGRVLGGAGV